MSAFLYQWVHILLIFLLLLSVHINASEKKSTCIILLVLDYKIFLLLFIDNSIISTNTSFIKLDVLMNICIAFIFLYLRTVITFELCHIVIAVIVNLLNIFLFRLFQQSRSGASASSGAHNTILVVRVQHTETVHVHIHIILLLSLLLLVICSL